MRVGPWPRGRRRRRRKSRTLGIELGGGQKIPEVRSPARWRVSMRLSEHWRGRLKPEEDTTRTI